ncbi:MAG: hypothetical protein Q7R95_09250 [bacterium]|nr:hypothetical protein [bacterium]
MKSLDYLIEKVLIDYPESELALGFLRYETLRKLNPRQFSKLNKRNLAGENFDQMVDDLIIEDK